MKIRFAFLLAFPMLLLINSCSGEKNNPGKNDSAGNGTDLNSGNDDFVLDNLLAFTDEAALKKAYGETNVRHDTIWGPEGMYYMGTLLFPGTENEVEISWEDTVHFAVMLSAQTVWHSDYNGNWKKAGQWKSKSGISLGISLKTLEKINGAAFKFYGFGWDYSGIISSWEGGKLDKQRTFVALGPGYLNENSPAYTRLLGDGEFVSSSADAQSANIVVVELSIGKQ